MNSLTVRTFFLFLFTSLLLSSCNLEDDNQNILFIGQEVKAWLAPFDEEGKVFTYRNEDGEVATLTVTHRNFATDLSFADCQRNNTTFQCQYENTTLEFSSDTSMYVTAWLFGEDGLTLNYSDSPGLTPEILRYRENEGQFENPQSDNFQVEFVPDYRHDNASSNAFIMSTTTVEGLFGALPPRSFVFVKGEGVVEWSDYSETTWRLED